TLLRKHCGVAMHLLRGLGVADGRAVRIPIPPQSAHTRSGPRGLFVPTLFGGGGSRCDGVGERGSGNALRERTARACVPAETAKLMLLGTRERGNARSAPTPLERSSLPPFFFV